MGNQWGDIYLCVPQTKMLGDVSPPVHSIIAALGFSEYKKSEVSAAANDKVRRI